MYTAAIEIAATSMILYRLPLPLSLRHLPVGRNIQGQNDVRVSVQQAAREPAELEQPHLF